MRQTRGAEFRKKPLSTRCTCLEVQRSAVCFCRKCLGTHAHFLLRCAPGLHVQALHLCLHNSGFERYRQFDRHRSQVASEYGRQVCIGKPLRREPNCTKQGGFHCQQCGLMTVCSVDDTHSYGVTCLAAKHHSDAHHA